MPLSALDVIWIWDGFIKPPGPKMVVCIEPASGFFYRINTKGKWQVPVPILKKDHSFLKHDSFIECGDPFELDDYIVDESIRRSGILGQIAKQVAPAIYRAAFTATVLSQEEKELIRAALGCAPIAP